MESPIGVGPRKEVRRSGTDASSEVGRQSMELPVDEPLRQAILTLQASNH
jgi:hypothetical protein